MRLIDAEALAEYAEKNLTIAECIAIKNALKKAETVEAEAVRHGRWIETSYDEYKCSACGKIVRDEIFYAIEPKDREGASMCVANYCPNCGANMRLEMMA